MDLIDRQDALEAICTWDKFGVDALGRVVWWHEGLEPYVHLRDVVRAIENMPSADRKGHWIKHGEPPWYVIECSECGAQWQMSGSWDANNFCGNCGAKMDVDEELVSE